MMPYTSGYGWGLFVVDDTYLIQKVDEDKRFATDEEARHYVVRRAREGSVPHFEALALDGQPVPKPFLQPLAHEAPKEPSPDDYALTGAYIAIGFLAKGHNGIEHLIDQAGHSGVVSDVTAYAEYICRLGHAGSISKLAGSSEERGWYGVFDYEVSEEFGSWAHTHAVKHKALPHPEVCRVYILNEVEAYFGKGRDEVDEPLAAALMSVPFGMGGAQ